MEARQALSYSNRRRSSRSHCCSYFLQLRTMQDQLTEAREEQRPYVSVIRFDVLDWDTGKPKEPPEFEIGKPIMVNVVFKNIGKTPAVDVFAHRHLLFGKDANRFRIEAPDAERGGNTLDPGTERVVTAASFVDTYRVESAKVNPDDFVKWDGSEPIIVFGRVTYYSTTGILYCTPYAVTFTWTKVGHWPMNWGPITRIDHTKTADFCPTGKR